MESVIKIFSSHGTFIQPDALEYILTKDDPQEFSNNVLQHLKECPLVLTLDRIKQIEQETKPSVPPSLSSETLKLKEQQKKILSTLYGDVTQQILIPSTEIEPSNNSEENMLGIQSDQTPAATVQLPKYHTTFSWKPPSKNYSPEIKILKDVTGKSLCEGTTSDFAKLFSDRFESLRKLLRSQRREIAHVIPIKRIRRSGIKEVQVIGIINDVRTTTNGHRLIEVEDDTGTITAIALKQQQDIFQLAQTVVPDEIIGLTGQLSKQGDLLVINNIVFPDISLNNKRHKAEIPVYAAFLADIHIGSKQFLEKQWQSFIRWINGELGNSRQKDVAGKIKYLVIPGDVVDGIGIYPNQEKELSITDLYKQYEALAEQLQHVPEYISIIMQPGNHDAVRPAEPQPTFEKEIQKLFTGNDVTFIGNPCTFSLHNVEILSYHGQSLLDFATNIQHLKYDEPVEIMKVMLQKHHLAPVYGGYTPLAPEHKDYMVIDRVPDIFVTGHVHLATIGEYRGVTLINASSWQAQTSYQKMLNFIPDPAKIPIADLHTGNVTMMDFNKQSW